jgi:hypothetical protein
MDNTGVTLADGALFLPAVFKPYTVGAAQRKWDHSYFHRTLLGVDR